MMSALHSRLPDTGSNGPGIHSSSKGSFCGDLKLSSIFEIYVRPICHKIKHTSVESSKSFGRAIRVSDLPGKVYIPVKLATLRGNTLTACTRAQVGHLLPSFVLLGVVSPNRRKFRQPLFPDTTARANRTRRYCPMGHALQVMYFCITM